MHGGGCSPVPVTGVWSRARCRLIIPLSTGRKPREVASVLHARRKTDHDGAVPRSDEEGCRTKGRSAGKTASSLPLPARPPPASPPASANSAPPFNFDIIPTMPPYPRRHRLGRRVIQLRMHSLRPPHTLFCPLLRFLPLPPAAVPLPPLPA